MEALAKLRKSVNGAVPGAEAAGGGFTDREVAIDWFWALVSFGLALGMFASGGLGPTEEAQRGLDGLGFLIAAGVSLPLLARRRAPVTVFLVVMASLVALGAFKYPPDVAVGPAVALFTLAKSAGRVVPSRLASALAIACFLAYATALTATYDSFFAPEIGFTGLVWIAIWFAGRGSRLKQEHINSLEERADRAEREAERERRLAAAEERTRIARDLHDSAGHAINVILVEAGAARLLRDRDPERAEQALETIEEVAREQIGEIDRLVHALRTEDSALEEDCRMPGDVPHGPEAGEALFERMRASGLDLETKYLGERRRLGPTVGRSIFRIAQESLTNALRHGTGSARVTIHFRDDVVEFNVENPIDGEGPKGEGHGLTGMRERVALVGGEFEAGASNGRFRVRAVLPYDRSFERLMAGREQEHERR